MYLPGAFHALVAQFARRPHVSWLAGDCLFFGRPEDSRLDTPTIPASPADALVYNQITQPAVFWRRHLFERFGLFDDTYRFLFDYDFFVRLHIAGERCLHLKHPVAGFRFHAGSKTVSQYEGFRREQERIRERFLPQLSRGQQRRFRRVLARSVRYERYQEIYRLLGAGERGAAWRHYLATVRRSPHWLLTPAGLACARSFALCGLGSARRLLHRS